MLFSHYYFFSVSAWAMWSIQAIIRDFLPGIAGDVACLAPNLITSPWEQSKLSFTVIDEELTEFWTHRHLPLLTIDLRIHGSSNGIRTKVLPYVPQQLGLFSRTTNTMLELMQYPQWLRLFSRNSQICGQLSNLQIDSSVIQIVQSDVLRNSIDTTTAITNSTDPNLVPGKQIWRKKYHICQLSLSRTPTACSSVFYACTHTHSQAPASLSTKERTRWSRVSRLPTYPPICNKQGGSRCCGPRITSWRKPRFLSERVVTTHPRPPPPSTKPMWQRWVRRPNYHGSRTARRVQAQRWGDARSRTLRVPLQSMRIVLCKTWAEVCGSLVFCCILCCRLQSTRHIYTVLLTDCLSVML